MTRPLLLATLLAAAPAVAGDHDHHAPARPSALDRLKALEGDWAFADGDGAVVSRWRVLGHGTTVAETLFPGTEHEMLTVYHLDGDTLVLTHYCAGGNQPRMRLASADGAALAFRFDGGTNIDSKTTEHMHDAELTLIDADHLRERWVTWSDGKVSGAKDFVLVRRPVAP